MLIKLRFKDHCQPDLIQYDFIIKMETLESDMMQIFNFTELFGNQSTSSIFADDQTTQDFFQNVGEKEISKLYNIYQEDFMLFNYSYIQQP